MQRFSGFLLVLGKRQYTKSWALMPRISYQLTNMFLPTYLRWWWPKALVWWTVDSSDFTTVSIKSRHLTSSCKLIRATRKGGAFPDPMARFLFNISSFLFLRSWFARLLLSILWSSRFAFLDNSLTFTRPKTG